MLPALLFIGMFVHGAVSFYQIYKTKQRPWPGTWGNLTAANLASRGKTLSAEVGVPISFVLLMLAVADATGRKNLLITQVSVIGLIISMILIHYILERNARKA